MEAVKRGDVQGFSFGFSIVKERFTDEGVRQLVEVNLREVSPCVFPAYPESSAIVRQKPQLNRKGNIMTRTNFWNEFDSDSDFYRAVIRASNKDVDPRLQMRAATGLGESPASVGGFLLTNSLIGNLLMGDGGSILRPLCDLYRVESGSGIFFPATDEETRVSGSELGGLTSEWLSENNTMTYVNPRLRGLSLSLKKFGCCGFLVRMSCLSQAETWLKDISPILEEGLFPTGSTKQFSGEQVAGEPLGIFEMLRPRLPIDKEGGQSADTVTAINIQKMFARLPANSIGKAVWLVHPTVFSQHFAVPVGVAGSSANLVKFDAKGSSLDFRLPGNSFRALWVHWGSGRHSSLWTFGEYVLYRTERSARMSPFMSCMTRIRVSSGSSIGPMVNRHGIGLRSLLMELTN